MTAVGVDDEDVEGSFRFALLQPTRALEALLLLTERDDVVVALSTEGPRVTSLKAAHLQVRLGKRTDWLGLDGEATLDDGTRLSLQSLIEALREGRRYVVIDAARVAALSVAVAAQLALVSGFAIGKHSTGGTTLAAGSVAEPVPSPCPWTPTPLPDPRSCPPSGARLQRLVPGPSPIPIIAGPANGRRNKAPWPSKA